MDTKTASSCTFDDILALDIYCDGVSCIKATTEANLELVHPQARKIPVLSKMDSGSFLGKTNSQPFVFVSGSPYEALYFGLNRLSTECDIDLEQTAIVLGLKEDPFIPFHEKFPSILKCVELLASLQPKLLCLQTSSSLALLVIPVLKRLKERACIHFFLPCMSDSLSHKLYPGMPLPSEILAAALAVREAGTKVVLYNYSLLEQQKDKLTCRNHSSFRAEKRIESEENNSQIHKNSVYSCCV